MNKEARKLPTFNVQFCRMFNFNPGENRNIKVKVCFMLSRGLTFDLACLSRRTILVLKAKSNVNPRERKLAIF
jgi:hypothetical protein